MSSYFLQSTNTNSNKKNSIQPDWIVGFVDGDGHFGFSKDLKRFYFVVSQDKRSVHVLYQLKSFFKCGSVHKAGQNMREYKVCSKKNLIEIIIPFFQKNRLQTSKSVCFENFVKQIDCKEKNKQFINEGLGNKPFSNQKLSIDWFAGFVDAEGCFVCSIINKTIRPQFLIGLNPQDKYILDKIQKNFQVGIRYSRKNSVEIFQISSNKQMCCFARTIILTKGFKDRLKSYKRIRARKWCKIVFLMEQQQHKTVKGFSKIEKLYKSF